MDISKELKAICDTKGNKAFIFTNDRSENISVTFNLETSESKPHAMLAHMMLVLFKMKSMLGEMPEIVEVSEKELKIHVSKSQLTSEQFPQFKFAKISLI